MFKNQKRNNDLRPQILKYFMSSVMTDDERAKLFGLPNGCRMREGSKIINTENLECGEFVWIGEGAVLDASGGLKIGEHTSIGLDVYVWSHTSYLANLALNNVIGSPLIERKATTIGKGCFIAGPSVVYPGVTIGDQVVILPMTVVTKDIPGNCIVSGAPAKVQKELTDEFIQQEIERVMNEKQKK